MKKIIKNNYLKAVLLFLNILINSFYSYKDIKGLIPDPKKFHKKDLKDLLIKLNYEEMICQFKGKSNNVELLNETLGTIASNKISGRFKSFGEALNREVFENIIKKEMRIWDIF